MERGGQESLSRRALIKRALTASAYATPTIVAVTVPERVAAASPLPPSADLAVTKSVDNPAPLVGSNVTFTVTVRNNGPDSATGVTLNDALPAGLIFVSATASQGSYNGTTGVWTIGTMAVGQGVTLTIVATATGPAGTARTNTATRTASSPTDPVAANDSASAIVTPVPVPTADIAVTKTVDNATPFPGNPVTFTATVTNNGPNAATGVVVSDAVPGAPFGLTSSTPSQGTYSAATGVWTIGSLAVGQSVTLTMVGTVGPAPVTNTATVTASNPTDPNPGNNSASATATPQLLA